MGNIKDDELNKANEINLGYQDEYFVGDIVTVWKYAKQPQNEHNNEVECEEAMIIGKRHKRRRDESEIEYEYLVADNSYQQEISFKSNYQLVPVEKK